MVIGTQIEDVGPKPSDIRFLRPHMVKSVECSQTVYPSACWGVVVVVFYGPGKKACDARD